MKQRSASFADMLLRLRFKNLRKVWARTKALADFTITRRGNAAAGALVRRAIDHLVARAPGELHFIGTRPDGRVRLRFISQSEACVRADAVSIWNQGDRT